MGTQLWQWGAADLARAIQNRDVSSVDVVDAHLDRIEEVNPKINAMTAVLADEARQLARAADQALSNGDPTGPLHGVPFTVKDSIDLAGTPTTFGSKAYADFYPEQDAPIVAHLKVAGAIPLGATNMSEFGIRWFSGNELYGDTINPWDSALTAGGSSGGEGAALATGMTPLGIGADMGGSLRHPAQCNGIATIRPSLGRISRITTETFGDEELFYPQIGQVNGPMARHVRDLRLALRVMERPDPGDPLKVDGENLGRPVQHPVKIALIIDPMGDGTDPRVEQGVRQGAAILVDAGYIVEEVETPSIAAAQSIVDRILDIEIKSFLPDILPKVSADTRYYLEIGVVGETEPELSTYMNAIAERHAIARQWSRFMAEYPLILGPVSTMAPFKVGYDLTGTNAVRRLIRSFGLAELCNLLGLPGVAVPVQMANDLPRVAQIIGWRFSDDLCLDAAEVIEQAVGTFTPIGPK